MGHKDTLPYGTSCDSLRDHHNPARGLSRGERPEFQPGYVPCDGGRGRRDNGLAGKLGLYRFWSVDGDLDAAILLPTEGGIIGRDGRTVAHS